jgi:streptogrisin C
MVRTSRVLAATAAVVTVTGMSAWAGVATAGTTPAAAPVAPSVNASGTGIEPGMAAAMRRDLRLTDAQIADRLRTEAGAAVIEKRLRAKLGATFAGAWLANGKQRLTVAVTDASAAAAVRAEGADATVVTRGEKQLKAAKKALDSRGAKAGSGVHSWYIDAATNTVVVRATKTAKARAAAFVAVSGADKAAVRVETTSEAAPRPMYDVRGGDQYVINGNTLCSVGFSVYWVLLSEGKCVVV